MKRTNKKWVITDKGQQDPHKMEQEPCRIFFLLTIAMRTGANNFSHDSIDIVDSGQPRMLATRVAGNNF